MDKNKKEDKKPTTSKIKSWFGSNKDSKKTTQAQQSVNNSNTSSPSSTVSRVSTASAISPKTNPYPTVESLKDEKKEAGSSNTPNASMPFLTTEALAPTNLTRKSSIDRLKAFMHIGTSGTVKSTEGSESKHSRRDSRASLRQMYSTDVDSKESNELKIENVQPDSQAKSHRPSNVNLPSPLGLVKSPSTPGSPRIKLQNGTSNKPAILSNGASSNINVYDKVNDLEKKVLDLENYIAAIIAHEKANISLAATCIQRIYRGYKARQDFNAKKGMKLYGTSQYPLNIESLHILHDRHYKSSVKGKSNEDIAATKIQGLIVNYLLRLRLRLIIKHNKAVIKLQSVWRGYAVRYKSKSSYPPLRSLIQIITSQSRAIQNLNQQISSISGSPKPKAKQSVSTNTRANLRAIHARSNTVGNDSKVTMPSSTGSLNEPKIRKKSLTMDNSTFTSPSNSDRQSPNKVQSRIPQLKDGTGITKLHNPRSQSASLSEFTSRIAKPGTIAGILGNGPPNPHPSIKATRLSSKPDSNKSKLLDTQNDVSNQNISSSPTPMTGYVTVKDYEHLKAEVEFLREAFDKLMATNKTN